MPYLYSNAGSYSPAGDWDRQVMGSATTYSTVSSRNQAHDHLLRKEETEKEGFQGIAYYIQQNPVRKENWKEYIYTDCVVPGYFNLNPRKENYWELFWRIHNKLVSVSD
jgi:hypothetical protein